MVAEQLARWRDRQAVLLRENSQLTKLLNARIPILRPEPLVEMLEGRLDPDVASGLVVRLTRWQGSTDGIRHGSEWVDALDFVRVVINRTLRGWETTGLARMNWR